MLALLLLLILKENLNNLLKLHSNSKWIDIPLCLAILDSSASSSASVTYISEALLSSKGGPHSFLWGLLASADWCIIVNCPSVGTTQKRSAVPQIYLYLIKSTGSVYEHPFITFLGAHIIKVVCLTDLLLSEIYKKSGIAIKWPSHDCITVLTGNHLSFCSLSWSLTCSWLDVEFRKAGPVPTERNHTNCNYHNLLHPFCASASVTKELQWLLIVLSAKRPVEMWIFQPVKLILKTFKWIAQGQISSKWACRDLNSGLSLETYALTFCQLNATGQRVFDVPGEN